LLFQSPPDISPDGPDPADHASRCERKRKRCYLAATQPMLEKPVAHQHKKNVEYEDEDAEFIHACDNGVGFFMPKNSFPSNE
jgi:hypothetical protein